jgi:hypothetical protein
LLLGVISKGNLRDEVCFPDEFQLDPNLVLVIDEYGDSVVFHLN